MNKWINQWPIDLSFTINNVNYAGQKIDIIIKNIARLTNVSKIFSLKFDSK